MQKSSVSLIARMILGVVFIAAAVGKITDVPAFANAIHHYRVVPPEIVNPVAIVLPWLELFCGLCFLAGFWVRSAAFWASMMTVIFTALVGAALYKGVDITCGCFGASESAQKIGVEKLAQNIGLVVLSLWMMIFPLSPLSIEKKTAATS